MKENVIKKYRFVIVELALLLVLVVGVTYAWFANINQLTTLIQVTPPDRIAITGPHGSEMLLLNLDFHLNSDLQEGESVTIRRPICIKSTSEVHQLEIAHTTNMKGLDFKIYPAKEEDAPSAEDVPGIDLETNLEYYYSYNKQVKLTGAYQNLQSEANGYRVADQTWHDKNFVEGDSVQDHAEPLYWLAKKCYSTNESYRNDGIKVNSFRQTEFNAQTGEYVEYYYTYYVIEITWTETTKETDLFYIFAQNCDNG